MNDLFGLLTNNNQPVPLLGVTVKGDLLGRGAKISIQQKFRNDEKKAIEAVYKFPLPEGSAVSGFKIWVNDRVTAGVVEERETAFNKYDDAMMQGDGAYLIDEERPNIFTLSAGNINPGMEVIIEIDLIMLMDNEGLYKHRLVLPTSISPRYTPADMPDEKGIPLNEIIHPLYAPDVPYGMSLLLDIHHHGKLAAVESPSHPIRVNLQQELTRVELSTDQVRMDHDFILLIDTGEQTAGQAWVFNDGDHTFYQLDVLIPNDDPEAQSYRGEIIFVLDCSGSMQGQSIWQAKKALELSLKSLSPGCSFNVYRFGSQYNSFFKKPQQYSENSLTSALQELNNTDANLGGTEIFQPLKNIYKASAAKYGRTIVLLTDGEVSNEQEIFDLATANRSHTRVFSIGIGAGPNEHLIKGMARAGSGVAEFVYPGERIEPKVLRLFNLINNPKVEISAINWNCEDFEQAPLSPAVFTDTVSTVFARTKLQRQPAAQIILKGVSGGAAKEWSFEVKTVSNSDMPVPQLWARERIRDLEESAIGKGSKQTERKQLKEQDLIIAISKTYGVLSRYTSYLGIEKRRQQDKTGGEVELRKVPALITSGWHGGLYAPRAAMPATVNALFAGYVRPAAPRDLSTTYEFRSKEISYETWPEDSPESDKTNIILMMLSGQQVDGGFLIGEKTARMLGMELKSITALSGEIKAGPTIDRIKLLSTLLVFEILESYFAADAKMWRGVTGKSRKWLNDILKKEMPKIKDQDLTNWVRDFVRNNIKIKSN